MDGDAESSTSRSKSQRNRRPPKQYEGALSWKEATRELGRSKDQQGKVSRFVEEGEDSDEDEEGGMESEDSNDSSSNGNNSNTSDEFIPDENRNAHKAKRRVEEEDDFGSDSGEEFGNSNQSEESDSDSERRGGGEGGNIDDGIDLRTYSTLQQGYGEMTTSERLKRAKKRMWIPPLNHGGLENPDDWKEAGQRKRQLQKESTEGYPFGEDGEVEVQGDELQNLAEAYSSGRGNDATIAQVERWQSALHRRDGDSEEEELDEIAFEQDMRGAVGFKRKTIRGKDGAVRRAPREQALSAPVAALLSEANLAYVDLDLPKTISKLEEVIKLEPAVRSAWATLALCFQELGEPERALQCRIMEAHLTSRPIDLWVELATTSQAMDYYEQASYCLSKAITSSREKDRGDVIDIMWDRSILLLEMDEPRKAAFNYLHMLQYRPQNQSIIRELIPLLFRVNMLERAIDILESCEEWNMEAFPDPLLDPAMMDENVGPDVRSTYESSEIVTLSDLLLRVDRPLEALHTIRRGARWLDGRGFEVFWNEVVADDREFDESREEGERESSDFGRRVDLAPLHYLEPEFRFQLAVARARLGDIGEAKRHFDIWKRDAHVSEQMDHYTEMADEYVRIGALESKDTEEGEEWFNEALQITSDLLSERNLTGEDTDGIIADYKRFAICYMGLNDSKEAIGWLTEVVNHNSDDLESKLRLAEAYENIGDRRMALDLVAQVVRTKKERQIEQERAGTAPVTDATLTQSLSFFAEIQQKVTGEGGDGASRQRLREEQRELERIREMETSLAWKNLKAKEDGVFVKDWWSADVDFVGDDESHGKRGYGDQENSNTKLERYNCVSDWLSDAEQLISMFQNTTQLYPRNRTKRFGGILRTKKKKADLVDSQANAILTRLGDDMFDEVLGRELQEQSTFRGVKLDDWVTLIMQYAFVLTKVGEFETAAEVIDRVIKSNVIWTDEERRRSVQLCYASCALYAQNYHSAFDQLAFFTRDYQFHNEPIRILSTMANSIGYSCQPFIAHSDHLKRLQRRSRVHELLAKGAPCSFSFTNKRWVYKGGKLNMKVARMDEEDEDEDMNEEVEDEQEGGEDAEEREHENGGDSDEDEDEYNDEEEDVTTTTFRNKKDEYSAPSRMAKDTWEDIKDRSGMNAIKFTPPSKYNPANDAFYASLLLISNNGGSSMAYLLRTFAYQQNDPLICLMTAIACFGRARNRQVDNRHQTIIQGFAFLDRYRQLRKLQERHTGEVSYNFGRAFHLLGLYQLAVPHYQEVLDTYDGERGKRQRDGEEKRKGEFKAWPEAAYNLAQIYLISGNPVLANQVMEKYLKV